MTREDVAKAEIGHTDISPAMRRTLVALFLATLVAVPLAQHVHDYHAWCGGRCQTPWPQFYSAFAMLLESAERGAVEEPSVVGATFAANSQMLRGIHDYEDELVNTSVLTQALLPPVQLCMAKFLSAGNEKTYISRDGWLFYRPGLDYLMGPAFLDPSPLARRAASANEWRDAPHADPRPAILQFARALAERDVRLVLVSAPTKATVHPDRFSGRFTPSDAPLRNASWALLRADLEREGVLIFDPAPLLAQRATESGGEGQFLKTDTHWCPEAVRGVAAALGAFLRDEVGLPDAPPVEYVTREQDVENLGDLASILKLPAGQRLFPPERVRIRQVRAPAGQPWRPSRSGSVLLLGDSFTNVYSVGLMGWGTSAGLAEQLSLELRRPVDRIAINDDASWATRAELAREIARGRDRLAGKSVVVWQFAERELASGDWRPIALPRVVASLAEFFVPAPGATVTVTGMVRAVSARPNTSAVYRDHVMTFLLVDLATNGKPIEPAMSVVHMLSMKERRLLVPARLRIGQTVTLNLQPWEDHEATFGGLRRSTLDDDDTLLADPCWGEAKE
jgi:alginate O-acetyltransferase complex protein AlgJ